MTGHIEQTVERYLELSGKEESELKPVETPCLDDHMFPPEDFQTKGKLSPFAARIVLKALYAARVIRMDLLWTVNALARMVTKWNVAYDKILHGLISHMRNATLRDMPCYVGDEPQNCKIAEFSDASFGGDLTDSKSITGAYLCLVGPNTWVPLTWMCKKH